MATTTFLLPLDAMDASLSIVGGKGANLARLVRAGFPVPPGFIVTTAAYDAFVATNHLAQWLLDTVRAVPSDSLDTLTTTSNAIRGRFAAGHTPHDLITVLHDAYTALQQVPVAVRSSATAEDLPGLSFAGQQDTYLNVSGFDALYKAIIDCWSSLWTARAIGYRTRNAIDHATVSLAVVIQAMVPSETSGVLFTANPLTGKRNETVINATFGLGEVLVSGQVEPDHYMVDTKGKIVEKHLGRKALAIHSCAGGGTITVSPEAAAQQALPDDAILELAHLGRRTADLFGEPQDIEWAWADRHLFVLQSRPITTLYPLPEGLPPDPLRILISFGAVQGMLDPMTPVGQDGLRAALTGLVQYFDHRLTESTQSALLVAGQRLWINFTGAVNSRIGRRIMLAALPTIDPVATQVIQELLAAGCFSSPGLPRPRTGLRLLVALLPMIARAVYTLLQPDASRRRLQKELEVLIDTSTAQLAQTASLDGQVHIIRHIARQAFRYVLPHFVPRFGMGMAMFNLLIHLARKLPGAPDVLVLTRGMPHNVTTEMDLALWNTAQAIRADPISLAHFTQTLASILTAEYLEGRLPEPAQVATDRFLHRYGARGLAEIDLGRPRWRDDPTPVMQSLQSYLRIPSGDQAPDATFERGQLAAEAGIAQLAACAQQTRGGRFKAWLIRAAAYRMRALTGLRESPKFTAIRIFGYIRQALLASGLSLVETGILAQADDVFFLYLDEMETLATDATRDWAALVRERRRNYEAERRRRQIPRVLLSDGQTFYESQTPSSDAAAETLTGSPVSPGVVEGTVHVVFDPNSAQLAPGEILVCPGTDPSWTPLFLTAGGLVMEVGGLMTHGGVVAREYGIPAVVGIPDVTRRLTTGQRIRVDGTTGQVAILDEGISQNEGLQPQEGE